MPNDKRSSISITVPEGTTSDQLIALYQTILRVLVHDGLEDSFVWMHVR